MNHRKTSGQVMVTISALLLILDLGVFIIGSYQYSKEYESYWQLAVKASSIEKKIEGIDKFVNALELSKMYGKYNALILETPNNNFDENMLALKSLQTRLHEIKEMDVTSFQYQTALQQITQQEQNEAAEMLHVFEGIWWKDNHFMLWDWIGFSQVGILIIVLVIGAFKILDSY